MTMTPQESSRSKRRRERRTVLPDVPTIKSWIDDCRSLRIKIAALGQIEATSELANEALKALQSVSANLEEIATISATHQLHKRRRRRSTATDSQQPSLPNTEGLLSP
jgi:hypothetical protein